MKNDFYRLIPSVKKEKIKESYEHALKCGISKAEAIMRTCQLYDLMFDQRMVDNCNDIGDYMRRIHSFGQYDGKKFIDSIIILNEKSLESSTEELNLLSALKNDQKLLLKKMSKAIDEDNIGTYKNLVTALKEITSLIQREEWSQQWSKYSSEDKEYVAVWEQKGSEIKNHRKFEIKNEDSMINYEKAYVEADRDGVCIYFKGEKTLIKVNDTDVMTSKVKEALDYNKEVPVYIDIRAIGMVVYDALRIEDYNVIGTSKSIIKIN